jgi:shikimate kinase
MGSGKSTIGRLLATRTGYRFVDADDEIASRAQASPSEIFSRQGEAYFRVLELGAIHDLLDGSGLVLATGGGAFAQADCAEDLLTRAFTIHLHCDFDEAYRRASAQGGRPLLEVGRAATEALYAERKDKYSRAHARIDTTHRTPDEVVGDVLALFAPL